MKIIKNIIRIILLFILLFTFIAIYGIPIIENFKIYLYVIKNLLLMGISTNFIILALIESFKEFEKKKAGSN